MPIKLITTDLDGTLMAPDHLTVTPRTVNALNSAHKKGIKTAIATGRPMAIIGGVTDQIPFCDYVISANGAEVYDRNQNKSIYSNLIPYKTAKKAVEFLLNNEVFFEIYIDGTAHYQFGTEKYFNTPLPAKFISDVIKQMVGHDDVLGAIEGRDVQKITVYNISDDSIKPFENAILPLDLSIASSFKGNMEFTAKTANKGTALKALCKILNIGADEVMSFGDAGNDCQMLEFAKYSFAMGNATDECRKSAKFVTKSNADDGLAQAVEEYALKDIKP
ncbi:MAG: Cof-type HAD-IIB family hydrolase [Eubacterium sp.]